MDMSDAYENRFRNPEFLSVRERWQKAMHAWEKARYRAWEWAWQRGLPFNVDPYVPDPEPLQGEVRASAEEYLAARAAYKAIVVKLQATTEEGDFRQNQMKDTFDEIGAWLEEHAIDTSVSRTDGKWNVWLTRPDGSAVRGSSPTLDAAAQTQKRPRLKQ